MVSWFWQVYISKATSAYNLSTNWILNFELLKVDVLSLRLFTWTRSNMATLDVIQQLPKLFECLIKTIVRSAMVIFFCQKSKYKLTDYEAHLKILISV